MKVYAFVPAKSSSERVENKNKRVLDGNMLYERAIKTLLNCREIDKVFLDTDSEEMYQAIDYLPIIFMKRDKNLASNATDGHQMFMNEVNSYPDADIYVQLLCTSPFIKSETIDSAIKILKESNEYDSAVMMKKDKFYFWENNKPSYDMNHIPNSKDLPETLIESMGLYIVKKETALKTNKRIGNNPYLIFGSLEELIDVNTPDDLEYAQTYAKGLKHKETSKFRQIKHFMTSALLSDILDDFEIKYNKKCGGLINGFSCNLSNAKMLGRASTIKLRKIRENEDFSLVYEALNHYKYLGENDIIVVENECSEFAYFGELNARLAIRAGAQGAVINGVTRDKAQTEILNFPVFSKGYNSQDVRRRAVLDYINKPVDFNGLKIHPHDLIFIDSEGMGVIYSEYEKEILETIFNNYINEKNIVEDILMDKKTKDILSERGAF